MSNLDSIGQVLQMEKWWMNGKTINSTNTSYSSNSLPGSLVGPSNSLYNSNKELKFYINDSKVRNASGSLICNLTTVDKTMEYAIVPFIDLDPCSMKNIIFFIIVQMV